MLLFKAGKGIESAAENGFNPYATRILRFVAIIPSGHTHASVLLFAGVSIGSVARRLGHASMTTTQKTYLHIIHELENQDVDLVMRSLSSLC